MLLKYFPGSKQDGAPSEEEESLEGFSGGGGSNIPLIICYL